MGEVKKLIHQGVDLHYEINFCLPVASKFDFCDVEKAVLQRLNWAMFFVLCPWTWQNATCAKSEKLCFHRSPGLANSFSTFQQNQKSGVQWVDGSSKLILCLLTSPKCDFCVIEEGTFQGFVWHWELISAYWEV